MIDNYDIMNADIYGNHNRFISIDEINKELKRMCETSNHWKEKILYYKEKYLLYLVKKIMLNEMQKDYYQNAANVLKFIDIDTHLVKDEEGNVEYQHVENLCIWQNGFYNFNSFNMTVPGMSGRRKQNSPNFNEEIAKELQELKLGAKLVEIPLEDRGSLEDYADLEAKILSLSKQHESYTE